VLFEASLNTPVEFGGRTFGSASEEDVVFNLQSPKIVFQVCQFFINRQKVAPFSCSG
jgi:hypothetical protein